MFFHLVTNLMMNHTQNFCRYPTLVARRKKNLPLFLYQAKNKQKAIITNLFVAKNITIISCNHKNQ